MTRHPPDSPLFPYTPLFQPAEPIPVKRSPTHGLPTAATIVRGDHGALGSLPGKGCGWGARNGGGPRTGTGRPPDRKSTPLNSSHANISYAVFCLKKKHKRCI